MSSNQDRAQQKGREARDDAREAANKAGEAAVEAKDALFAEGREAAEETKQAADKAAQKTKEGAEQAKEKGKEAAETARDKAVEAKDTFVQKLKEDGVVNPQGLAMAGFGALFLAAIPLTSWVASPNGLLEKAVNGVAHSVTWLGTAGASSRVAQTGKIAALSTLYMTVTYAFSGAGSAAGIAASTEEGRDNKEPRKQIADLKGLPLRLYSAHYNLMEMFPGFALTAALTQAMAPADQSLINLLGLHVLVKTFLYYPAYIFNIDQPRTLAHIIATASVLNVGLRLAKRPLL